MAVSTTNAISGPYLTNGVTTSFPFTFTAPSADEVDVVLVDAAGSETSASGYSVILGQDAGGSATFSTPPAPGYSLYVLLDPSFRQDIAFENGSAWRAEPVNEGYDRAAARDQVLRREAARGLKAPIGEGALMLPGAARRAGGYLAFDAGGDPLPASGTGADSALRFDMADPAGSQLLGFRQSLVGAVARTQASKNAETVSLKDFGAKGNGETDDTAAIQRAYDSGVASIYAPEGRYRVRGDLFRDGNTLLYGDGRSASVLVMEQGATLKYFGGSAAAEYMTHALQIERLGFLISGASENDIVDASWDAGIGGTSNTFTMRDCQISAIDPASSFRKALRLSNARNVVLDNIRILGDRDGPPIGADYGIDIFGSEDGAPVEIYMSKVLTYYCKQAVNISGWVEGINIDQCAAINCERGIRAVASTTSPRPWIRAVGNHLNTDTSGIEFENFVQWNIQGNLIYGTNFDGVSEEYVGIRANGRNASLDSLIVDNNLQCLLAGVPKNGIVVESGDPAADDNVTIGRNIIVGFDTGIVLEEGTKNVRVLEDNDIRFCTGTVADLGDNLNCRAILSPTNGSKAAPDGFCEKWGSSIITLNASGDGVITFDDAFTALLTGYVVNGDPAIAPTAQFIANAGASNAATIAFSVRPNPGGISVRANWRAVGRL